MIAPPKVFGLTSNNNIIVITIPIINIIKSNKSNTPSINKDFFELAGIK